MRSRLTARIEIFTDESATLRFPYRENMVEDLKSLVPAHDRDYDPSAKVWTVYGSAHIALALDLLRRHFGTVDVTDWRQRSERAYHGTTLDHDYATLHLLPSAPSDVVRVVYRTLALHAHPDRGGDHEQMLALNASFDRLQRGGAA